MLDPSDGLARNIFLYFALNSLVLVANVSKFSIAMLAVALNPVVLWLTVSTS